MMKKEMRGIFFSWDDCKHSHSPSVLSTQTSMLSLCPWHVMPGNDFLSSTWGMSLWSSPDGGTNHLAGIQDITITVLEFSQIIPVGECPACKRYLLHLLKSTPSITVRGSTWAQSLTPGLPQTGPAQLYGAALLRAPCYWGAQCEWVLLGGHSRSTNASLS